MIEEIKQVLETKRDYGNFQVLAAVRNKSYVYVISSGRIFFTSTYDAIRYNSLIDNEEVKNLLKETAEKLGRRFIEAEYPSDFLDNTDLARVYGNWDPKVLGISRTTVLSGATAAANGTSLGTLPVNTVVFPRGFDLFFR